ncbi:MAG: DUF134 domain-containing protein [Victivallales bacterium]|nr:DUF134 domain-containing protein [Victivallales bacterium]
MPRPEKYRNIRIPPGFDFFKPAGIFGNTLEQTVLSLDEYEALRLADYEGLDHCDAAGKMQISRPTFTRLLARARRKLTGFIVEGRALRISGGAVHFSQNLIRCLDCGARFPAALTEAKHVCPECGSVNYEDLARNFGHGRCCRRFRNQGR